ncbi:MAG: P-II family nitrogen regulator [Clostridia bacterium]|nr:P-II family nitrogen regulator [Clostridia bacterium]
MSELKYTHEAIFCIVNSGFSEAVMDAAKKFGARGGTVINARGTAGKDAEKFFGITVQQEKEIVMILVPQDKKENILRALYEEVGLNTAGQGIAFSLPVDSVVGVNDGETTKKVEA